MELGSCEPNSQRPQTRIAVVGDYDPARPYHPVTTEALHHAANALGVEAVVDWVPTDALDDKTAPLKLPRYSGVFLAPGAPYRSSAGAFAAIRFAREQGWPFVGT